MFWTRWTSTIFVGCAVGLTIYLFLWPHRPADHVLEDDLRLLQAQAHVNPNPNPRAQIQEQEKINLAINNVDPGQDDDDNDNDVGGTVKKLPTFLEIAESTKTSKVTEHGYQCLYEEAFAPFRNRPGLKFLEIGLGCGMSYGPGKSYDLWAAYFSDDTQIYFLEFNKKCGAKWLEDLKKKLEKEKSPKPLPIMVYGDQSDRNALQKLAADYGPWDIVVDDGCHRNKHQQVSFDELWGSVNPGGLYVIEDLYSSTRTKFGGTASGMNEGKSRTTINMIGETYAASIIKTGHGKTMDKLVCCSTVCSLTKGTGGAEH